MKKFENFLGSLSVLEKADKSLSKAFRNFASLLQTKISEIEE